MLEITNKLSTGTSSQIVAIDGTTLMMVLSQSDSKMMIIDSVTKSVIDSFNTRGLNPSLFALDQASEKVFIIYSNRSLLDTYQKQDGRYTYISSHELNLIPTGINFDSAHDIINIFDSAGLTGLNASDYSVSYKISGTRLIDSEFYNESAYVTTTPPPVDNSNKFLFILSAEEDKVYKYNLETSTVDADISVGLRPENFYFAQSLGKLFVANHYSDFISVINISDNSVSNIPSRAGVSDLAVDEKNEVLLAINNKTDRCEAIDLSSGAVITRIALPEFSTNIVMSQRFRKVFISHRAVSRLTVINLYDFDTSFITLDEPADNMSISEERSTLYFSNRSSRKLYAMSVTDTQAVLFDTSIFGVDVIKPNNKNQKIFAIGQDGDNLSCYDYTERLRTASLGTENSPSHFTFDDSNDRIYISHSLIDKISVYSSKNLDKLDSFITINDPDKLVFYDATPTTTTTTTTSAPTSATLTITSETNPAIETHVLFYGEAGDTIHYNYIAAPDLSSPIVFKEILIVYQGVEINRLTLPEEYITNNVAFTLTSGGVTLNGNFGSIGEVDGYRRIEFT